MNEDIEDISGRQQAARIAEIRRDDAYKALGIYVYDMTKRGQISDPRIFELTERIDLIINEVATDALDAWPADVGSEEQAEKSEENKELERQGESELDQRREKYEAVTIKCPHCGEELEDGSVICLFCGKSTEATQYKPAAEIKDGGLKGRMREEDEGEEHHKPLRCPHCGDELEAGAVFCIACGKEAAMPTGAQELQPKPAITPERVDPSKEVGAEIEIAVVQVRTCPHCGDELEKDTVFCLSCGRKVDED